MAPQPCQPGCTWYLISAVVLSGTTYLQSCLTQQVEQTIDVGPAKCDWLQQVVLTPGPAAAVPVLLVRLHAAVLLMLELAAVQPVVLEHICHAGLRAVSSSPVPCAQHMLPLPVCHTQCPLLRQCHKGLDWAVWAAVCLGTALLGRWHSDCTARGVHALSAHPAACQISLY